MKLNINLDYGFTEKMKKAINMSDAEYTLEIVSTAAASTYKEGLSGQLGRVHGRLIRKIEAATTTPESTEIELETAELDHLKKILNEGKFNPIVMPYVVVLQDAVNQL